jgi:MFS family permease
METATDNLSAKSSSGNLTLADALANPMFYLLLYVTAAVFFCITGVVQNFALFMRDVGLDSTQTANALSLFFICSIAGKLVFGALSDYFSKKNILVAAVINMTTGSVLMRFIPYNSDVFLPLFAVIYGLGYSGAFTMVQLTVAEYYAGKNFGKILGLVTTMDTLAGSAGIYLLGTLRTTQGNYLMGIHILIGVSVSALLCAMLIQKPQAAITS